ncbi:protein translocase subunit SecF [Acanthopleuribacter pedis]|uniref:Protein-export membrane protein SecF n=1 Tax=Acanthopleuribacter pedis TaxID=442870 RepID=A0A8J7Q6H4_9BACT|nr:protein translocase subunit SecF [Acanthopleuribacter pedis]MBO1319036.1 protein translocase subunit SecF [Acanthopleuribacter pedis]
MMREIQFMEKRGAFGLLSVILFIASLGVIFTVGIEKSVDYEGGTKLTVQFETGDVQIADLRAQISQVDNKASLASMDPEFNKEYSVKIKNPEVAEGKEGEASLARLRGLEKAFGSFFDAEAKRIALLQGLGQQTIAEGLVAQNPFLVEGTDAEKQSTYGTLAGQIVSALDGEVADIEALAAAVETDADKQLKLSQTLLLLTPALNRTTEDLLAVLLREKNPLNRASTEHYEDVARDIIAYRESKDDFVKDFATMTEAITLRANEDKAGLQQFFEKNFMLGSFRIVSNETFSPSIASEQLTEAAEAIILALIGILIYIAFRFRLGYAVASVVALVHDVVIALGVFAIAGQVLGSELSNPVVAAFLTIVGYSLNDTIVVFDRIRENLNAAKGGQVVDHMNRSINQTLSRTIVTSLTTFFVVGVIYWFSNNATLEDFALPLLIGIVIGTYSSIFVASPTLLLWHASRPIDS